MRLARIGHRGGFTLVEILVAMTLTLAVFAITLPFVRAQTRALGATAGRMDADQIARYAQRAIDRDLRLATADEGQPLLVYAGPLGIAFNANLLAQDSLDPNALDLQAGAATTLTEAWLAADAGPLPFGGRNYPPQDYLDGQGDASRNETISYFLHPDTITGRSDIYVLYRRVNGRDSVQLVRSLQVPSGSAFFSYLRPVGDTLAEVAAGRLPFYWDSTAIDSISTVELRAVGFYRERTTGKETLRRVTWRTHLMNADSRLASSCGAAPTAPSGVDAAKDIDAPGPYRVEVRWNRSTDDGGNANDVSHYVVERRSLSGGAWLPLATVPATGAAAYEWHHVSPGAGGYAYGVRAVDCGGATSARDSNSAGTLP
jgi:type II secretory pathway pseudopilin PulG